MRTCRWIRETERWLDGESRDQFRAERHIETCPVCTEHARRLQQIRNTAVHIAPRVEVGPAQFPAFMAGIRDRMAEETPRRRGRWALVSVGATALVVSLAVFYVMTGGPQEVLAVEVEKCATEVEGARVATEVAEGGVMTVMLVMPEGSSK